MPELNPKAGETRSYYAPHDHLLQTPDTFVPAPLPGMVNATAIVHAAPAMGAGFVQYTALLNEGGSLAPQPLGTSRFTYVLDGALSVDTRSGVTMPAGAYCVQPPDAPETFHATTPARVAVIEKPYEPLPGNPLPSSYFGFEPDVLSTPLLGDENLQVRALVPDNPAWDFAVNTMSFQPGAALSMTEIHVMEHGLLLLEGDGEYKLNHRSYQVQAGDFIWMAPFCPQWFQASASAPAKYLIYKDWNRHPLTAGRR